MGFRALAFPSVGLNLHPAARTTPLWAVTPVPSGLSAPLRRNMDSLENLTEEEEPRGPRTPKSAACKPRPREVLAGRTQSYLEQTQRAESSLTYVALSMLLFSVVFPYILLSCFFIQGLFLEGGAAGLRDLRTVKLSAWASLDLWRQAGSHVLYSLGLGTGTIINLSCKAGGGGSAQDASLVVLASLITSLLATAVIFTVLGFWVTTSGPTCVQRSVRQLMMLVSEGLLPPSATPPPHIQLQPPLDYLAWVGSLPRSLQQQIIHRSPPCSIKPQTEKFMEGPGLAFAAFSQAVTLLPGAPFWAILFFLTLLALGLNTLVTLVGGLVSPLQSTFSVCRRYPRLLSALICSGGFLGSLVCASEAGSYIVAVCDDLLVPLALVAIVAFQNVTLAWIYGARRFRQQPVSALGHLLWPQLPCLWRFLTLPVLLGLLAACVLALYPVGAAHYVAWNSSVGQEVRRPHPQSALSWVRFLGVLALLPVPAHPLRRWWRLQDHEAAEAPGRPPSRRRPPQWPKGRPARPSSRAPRGHKKSVSSQRLTPLAPAPKHAVLWQTSLTSAQPSQSSWSSLMASLTSFLSVSPSLPLEGGDRSSSTRASGSHPAPPAPPAPPVPPPQE
ncbi:PREDICTED: orphan sodium- and chloride-dependent neurotransmitter transporter NTT5-like [Condylura cristata]|uniref:orphan sodium- and chloride-dependent neurotransmitter transporter NTT5-like n=1 Tax=Condylura cristata TaxID=143302 RepID=UPI000642A66B|nr:PREDICTED: orphan sodium- and chloride-dependent neurotransmitter transporter NTT5-like [Condylura cristata]